MTGSWWLDYYRWRIEIQIFTPYVVKIGSSPLKIFKTNENFYLCFFHGIEKTGNLTTTNLYTTNLGDVDRVLGFPFGFRLGGATQELP